MTWLTDSMQGLPCRVLLPEPYAPQTERYPLIVFLHGSAERGTDNEAQLRNGLQGLEGKNAIVVAPQCGREDTWGGSWYGGTSRAQEAVVELVRELAGRRSVDTQRIVLIGFSMGAIGAWEIVARYRALFSCAVMIAGDLELSTADKLGGFPLWAFHGEKDELVPSAATKAAVAKLWSSARFTELAGAGHDISGQVLARADLHEWIFARRR